MFTKFADDIWLENAANVLEDRVTIQSKIRDMPQGWKNLSDTKF